MKNILRSISEKDRRIIIAINAFLGLLAVVWMWTIGMFEINIITYLFVPYAFGVITYGMFKIADDED